MKKPGKKEIILFIAGIIVALLLAELVLRAYYGLADKPLAGATEDDAFRNTWYATHQDTTFHREQNSFEGYDPLLGWSLRPYYKSQYFNVNSKGFRGREYGSKNSTRFLIFGDSFTFGETTSDDMTYPAYIEQFSDIEALNFGVPAYGVDQMYLRYKQEAPKYDGDLVILAIYLDDIPRNYRSFYFYPKPKFEIVNGKLELTNSPVISPEDLRKKEAGIYFESQLLNTIRYNHWLSRRDGVMYDEGFAVTDLILDDMKKEVETQGGRFVVVRLLGYNEGAEAQYADKLRQLAESKNITYIDTEPYFLQSYQQYGKENFWSGHYNHNGNQVVALSILSDLASRGIIRGPE